MHVTSEVQLHKHFSSSGHLAIHAKATSVLVNVSHTSQIKPGTMEDGEEFPPDFPYDSSFTVTITAHAPPTHLDPTTLHGRDWIENEWLENHEHLDAVL